LSKESETELHAALSRLAEHMPSWGARLIEWLRRPNSRYVRAPIALLLIVGGLIGFLPILGFWMVPLGLAVLALDVPFLQRPLARLIRWVVGKIEGRKK
jgi:hypothetical protein